MHHYYILTHRHVSGANGKGNQHCFREMSITNDLEKNGENTEIPSLFKAKILCAIDRIKEKK